MKLVIKEAFVQDLEAIRDGKIRARAEKAVGQLAEAKSLKDLSQVRQMQGSKNAFRLRVGDYRLGFFLIGGVLELSCFLHRREIYREFP